MERLPAFNLNWPISTPSRPAPTPAQQPIPQNPAPVAEPLEHVTFSAPAGAIPHALAPTETPPPPTQEAPPKSEFKRYQHAPGGCPCGTLHSGGLSLQANGVGSLLAFSAEPVNEVQATAGVQPKLEGDAAPRAREQYRRLSEVAREAQPGVGKGRILKTPTFKIDTDVARSLENGVGQVTKISHEGDKAVFTDHQDRQWTLLPAAKNLNEAFQSATAAQGHSIVNVDHLSAGERSALAATLKLSGLESKVHLYKPVHVEYNQEAHGQRFQNEPTALLNKFRADNGMEDSAKNFLYGELHRPDGKVVEVEPVVSGFTKDGSGDGTPVPGLAQAPQNGFGYYAELAAPVEEPGIKTPRHQDTEVKFLNHARELLKNQPAGTVLKMYSDNEACISCQGVIEQFREEHPGAGLEMYFGRARYVP